MEQIDVDRRVRGDYTSVDLFLVPKATIYVDLLADVFEAFDEDTVELVIDESSMPLPYYEALEIPLEVFEEEHGIEDEEEIDRETALDLCEDLLELGLFDIGFRGDSVAVHISHDGHLNVKPLNIDRKEFQETVETIGGRDGHE